MIVLHFPIKRAVGISVVTVALVSLVAVFAQMIINGHHVHWRTVGMLTLGSLLGSVLGANLLRRLPDTPLQFLYAGSLLFVSARMVVSTSAGDTYGALALSSTSVLGMMIMLPVGVLAGLSSTLFGIGGGIVTVPCLSLLFQDLGFHAARATALATICPTSAFAAYQHERLKHVKYSVARWLIPPGFLGAVLGVAMVNVLPSGPARTIFAAVLVLAAVRVLMLPGLKSPVSTTKLAFGMYASVLGLGLIAAGPTIAPLFRPVERIARLEQGVEPGWAPYIRRVDAALAERKISAAEETWHAAYAMALRSRSWQGLVAVGDASFRIACVTKSRTDIERTRQNYLSALFLARRAGAVDGMVDIIERVAALGDSGVTQGLEIAQGIGRKTDDAYARARLAAVAATLEQVDRGPRLVVDDCGQATTVP
jgi:uncharacterized membrane protein YfcA